MSRSRIGAGMVETGDNCPRSQKLMVRIAFWRIASPFSISAHVDLSVWSWRSAASVVSSPWAAASGSCGTCSCAVENSGRLGTVPLNGSLAVGAVELFAVVSAAADVAATTAIAADVAAIAADVAAATDIAADVDATTDIAADVAATTATTASDVTSREHQWCSSPISPSCQFHCTYVHQSSIPSTISIRSGCRYRSDRQYKHVASSCVLKDLYASLLIATCGSFVQKPALPLKPNSIKSHPGSKRPTVQTFSFEDTETQQYQIALGRISSKALIPAVSTGLARSKTSPQAEAGRR